MIDFEFRDFHNEILSGAKRQTIRKQKRGFPGDKITLRVLDGGQICAPQTLGSIISVTMHANRVHVGQNVISTIHRLDDFAVLDGFRGRGGVDNYQSAWQVMAEYFDLKADVAYTGFIHTW